MLGSWDKNKIILITIFALTVFFALGAVSATENIDESSNYITDNNSALENLADNNISTESSFSNSMNDSDHAQDLQNSPTSSLYPTSQVQESIINGIVTRCNNGSSFPGVNLVLNSMDGTELARTITDSNGFFQFAFLSNDRTFYVTASHPGHMTLSKLVTLEANTNSLDHNLYAWINFQLGPEPTLAISTPGEQFLNETFDFTLTFDNVGNETGFGPIIQLIMPPEIEFNPSAVTFLTVPVNVIYVGNFTTGPLVDPLSKLNVTGPAGYRLYILEYPLGSYTKGQPAAIININALLLGNATLGVPLNITGYPVFRFGANETGITPIRGNASTGQVIPTVISITKECNAEESETATGYNYLRTYTLTVDVARGRTVNDVVVRDDLPYNMEFVEVTPPSGATVTHYPTNAEHWLSVYLGNLTGKLNTPKIITYKAYANKTDIYGNPVLNPNTGASTNATNNANVTGTYQSIIVSDADNYTLTLRSLAIQKSSQVEPVPVGSVSPKPGDIIRYTLDFQVSDYFSLQNVVILDTLGDGQSFISGVVEGQNRNPTLRVHLPPGFGPSSGWLDFNFNLSNPYQFNLVYNPSTGISYITFNISQLLIDHGYLGILQGGNYTGTNYGATRGYVTFWSRINTTYVNPPHANPEIVSNDPINNRVDISANLVNNPSQQVTESSGSEVRIVTPTSTKKVYAIERNGVIQYNPDPNNIQLQPGDKVTFSLEVYVPTTNLEAFCLTDYLPIPLFRASEFTNLTPDTINTPPLPGRWKLGVNDTLTVNSGVTPTLVIDTAQNTLNFRYCNIFNATQPYSLAQIWFTVTATGDPFADGLYLTNWLNVHYNNTFQEQDSQNIIIKFRINEPMLAIEKNATPTNNLQAGDVVTYTVAITNTGHGIAYNVAVQDDLLISNPGFISNITIAARYVDGVAITGLNLMDIFTTGGLNFSTLYPIYPVNSTNNTILITYNATLNGTVYPLQYINNTVNITKFTALPPPESPNFVGSPAIDQSKFSDNASVRTASPTFSKDYLGSVSGPSTGSNLTIGETGTFRFSITLPAGQIQDLFIRDTLPNGLVYVSHTPPTFNPSISLPAMNFYQNGQILTFAFNGTTNITNGTNRTFYINLTVRMANNNTANPPHTTSRNRDNTATLDWNNPGHTPLTDTERVTIIEPWLTVNKIFNPSTIEGGQTTTVTIQVNNTRINARSTAYNVIITDSLAGAGQIFDLSSVVEVFTPSGFSFNYNPATYLLTYTGGNISQGQSLNFIFNITALTTPFIGPSYNNTVNATYWSLPWVGGVPDPNSRNYTDSGWGVVRTGDPKINKTVETSTIHGNSGLLTIGEVVTYKIQVTLPQGLKTNLTITDTLPAGFSYRSGEYWVDTSSFSGTLPTPPLVSVIGQNVTFLFNGLTNSTISNNTFYLLFNATVLNQSINFNGANKNNTVALNWTENTRPPFTAWVNTTIVEPRLTVSKVVTPSLVDGGDVVTVTLRVNNIGTSPAYQVDISDVLNTVLFDSTTVSVVSIPVGFTFYPGSTVRIVANPGTVINNGSGPLNFVFSVQVNLDAPTNSTFQNWASILYSSMPAGFNETRNYTNTSNVVNISTVNPAISKSLNATSQSLPGNAVPVGEVITYQLNFTVPEGKTLNVSLVDVLPANLSYNAGSALIKRSSSRITATGFDFGSFVDQFISIVPSSTTPLTFSLGNVTYSGASGLRNGTITLIFNATVLNISGNVNGVVIRNNGTLNFTNSTGSARSLTTNNVDVTVREPRLTISKVVTPSLVDGGDVVTVTLRVNNIGTSPAYQVDISDVLNTVLFDSTTVSVVSIPVGFTFYPGSTVRIVANPGTVINNGSGPLNFVFSVQVNLDAPTNSTFQNWASILYSSMPAGFNETRNYTNTSNIVNITTTSPSISKAVNATSEPDSKVPNVFIGEVVTYQITFTVPEGKTLNVSLIDLLQSNLGYNTGSALIKRSSSSITATGFDFGSFVDQFISINPSNLSPLTFTLGNVTNLGGPGLGNGTITLLFNTTVLNIAANQAGTQIPNNATLNFTNATGESRNITAICPTTLNVVVPQISVTKTANPTILTVSDTVTFTIQLLNNNNTNGAPAYNLQITDPMTNYVLDYLNMIIVPSDPAIIFNNYSTANLLNITIIQMNQTQYLNITYNATVKPGVIFNSTINNTVNATGTTLPGDHGTNNATPGNPGETNGKRTGDPTQPAGAVNDIAATANATVTTRPPRVSKNVNGTKTVTLTIGETATESININLPVGSTSGLRVIDVLPTGLAPSGFSYAATPGISVNQFVVTFLGGNTYEIDFGNVTVTQEGNLTINYTVLVQDISGNYNGQHLTNTATLFYRNITGHNVNAGQDTATIQIIEPNLQITKTPSKTNLNIGEQFTYTLFITHTPSSTADAYNLIITDTLPTGITFVTGSEVCPGWSFTQAGNLLTFKSPFLALDDYSTILFNCTVDNNIILAGQNITNIAILNYTSISSGGRNYTTNNSTQIHIIGADLQVIKNGDTQVNAGQQVTYTITVTNLGPDTAENVTLNDIFSAPWFTYLANPEYSLNFGTWTAITSSPWSLTLGNMISGNSTSVRIRANVIASAPAGILNNTVNVTSNTTDPNPSNNNSTASTNVTQTAVLTLLKENNPTNIVIAGNSLLYTLTLTNTGPSVARDVTLKDDTLSSYYLSRFYSYSVNGGAWSVWTGFSGPLVINVTNTSIFPAGYMGVGDIFRVMINGTVNASAPNGTVLLNNGTVDSSTSPFNVTSNTVSNVV
ncbi:MAG: DUF11 domain-containing protein, partial [Methanobacteriaceae archaeon]|nr:DUF11 domain-containing protein [Methanobacteriaceae archaeon]